VTDPSKASGSTVTARSSATGTPRRVIVMASLVSSTWRTSSVARCRKFSGAQSREIAKPRKRVKSRSSVSRVETPDSRQTATIWALDRSAGLAHGMGRVEEPRVGDDANELAEARRRDTPEGTRLGQPREASARGGVLNELATVRIDEDVRVDRDQPRPSMRS